ncbi:MAG: DEAD/DEAH box helicase family protein, partial [Phycisphaerales bacterium]
MGLGFYELDLDEARGRSGRKPRKTPFDHQLDAFQALSGTYTLDGGQGKGGLLVLPTGAGKTFTTVSWICENVLKRNIKVLWLAQSFYLLDQACQEFLDHAPLMPETRDTLNVRVVSSTPSHNSASDIQPTDDVVIITTQTAMGSLHVDAVDRRGKRVMSQLRQFVENSRHTGLFVVLDEAHHAPAYGCRNLLTGKDVAEPGLRTLVPAANLLGLTATPTYTDETRRGWLGRIFDQGVIYEADQAKLTVQGILARPNYVPRPTGRELVVDDRLYNQLVREHKDLPEEIIEKLANDSLRNDSIVKEYEANRAIYGKTIIFADRWFQCVYLKSKLRERGIRADAIYSHIDADPGSAEARNERQPSDNERILHEFKHGKDSEGRDTLDVLVNVRMLTEGADVPSVRTVFLTRQTTSRILLKQMIGRALRGRQAGGDDEANIVMFVDEWKRLIDWASPVDLAGGTGEDSPVRGHYPLEYVSIQLVEKLADHINNPDVPIPPFERVMPIGWYQTEVVVGNADTGETQSFVEFAMAYEHTKPKFDALIDSILRRPPAGWDREVMQPNQMQLTVGTWIQRFFDADEDNMDNCLAADITRIARHTAQRSVAPVFHPFEERDQHNLDTLAAGLLKKTRLECDEFLRREYARPERLWHSFFRSYERFSSAVDAACMRLLDDHRHGHLLPPEPPKPRASRRRELSEAEKEQVKKRDGYACLCCGASGKGVRLQADHIHAYALGGETSVENTQTLCSVCNREKKVNEINFLSQTVTQ